MKRASFILVAVVSIGAAGGASAHSAEWFEHWQLEGGVTQANLILVAQVASVGQTTIVQGAKTDTVLREYRFRPIGRLKGLFDRDELSLSSTDLSSAPEYAGAPPLVREGEFRLLILVQQQEFMSCIGASPGMSTFAQRAPLLTGPDDPIVAAVTALIRAADARSRRERVKIVATALASASGPAAVPLALSLKQRAVLASQDANALEALARLAEDPSPTLRDTAISVLADTLEWNPTFSGISKMERLATIVQERLSSDNPTPTTQARLNAIATLGRLARVGIEYEKAVAALVRELRESATHVERAAAAEALRDAGDPAAAPALLEALRQLPLDHDASQEAIYCRAALRLNRTGAAELLVSRLARSVRARQAIATEARLLGEAHVAEAVPALIAAAEAGVFTTEDQYAIAEACGQLADERAAPLMAHWLRSSDNQLQWFALDALESIDKPVATLDWGTLVRAQPYLPLKLRMARLAARHKAADVYALATEHLADHEQTIPAALVLAALADPRANAQLTHLFGQATDRRWRGAALAGLAAIDVEAIKPEIMAILGDERHPLVVDATAAVALSSDPELLAALTPLIESRGAHVATAALVAVRRHCRNVKSAPRGLAAADVTRGNAPAAEIPQATRERLFAAVRRVLLDVYVDASVRQEAFWTARALGGSEYHAVVLELADQSELEGSSLLRFIEAELRNQFRYIGVIRC